VSVNKSYIERLGIKKTCKEELGRVVMSMGFLDDRFSLRNDESNMVGLQETMPCIHGPFLYVWMPAVVVAVLMAYDYECAKELSATILR